MKFTIKQKTFENAMRKGLAVCTRGIKTEFKDAHKITLRAEKDKVVFLSTNGYLDIITTVSDECTIAEEGTVTLNAGPATKIVSSIGRDDDEIDVVVKGDPPKCYLNNKNRKRNAKLETETSDLKFSISKPKDGFEHAFACDVFCKSVNALAKYKSPLTYHLRYLMLCIHFLPDYTRFICGCGMRFGVLEHKNRDPIMGLEDSELGDKKLMTAEQASIISSVINGEKDILLKWKENKNCYIESGNSKLYLKGIPEEEYISYELHAYRFGDALAVVDISKEEMSDISDLVGAVRDKASESEGDFHTCHFKFNSSGLATWVSEGKYQMDADCEVKYYKISADEFESQYCHDYLKSCVDDSDYDTLRFYCIDPQGIVIVEPIRLNIDDDGKVNEEDKRVPDAHCPGRKLKDDYEPFMIFFFTAAIEEDDEQS